MFHALYSILLLFVATIWGDGADILHLHSNSFSLQNDFPEGDSNDFSPGLLFFALIGLAFILICVGMGIVLTIFLLLIAFGLISAGIISTSVVIGISRNSFSSGFKVLLVSFFTLGGFLAGLAGFWIVNRISHWWNDQTALLVGAISGVIAGLILGVFSFYVIRKLTLWFIRRLKHPVK